MTKNRLDKTFSALADPTRRAILERLMQGEATVKELTEPFNISQPAISRHLKVLEQAGLIEGGKKAQARPRRLRAQPMRMAYDWLDEYRQSWEFRSSNLSRVLHKLRSDLDRPTD